MASGFHHASSGMGGHIDEISVTNTLSLLATMTADAAQAILYSEIIDAEVSGR
jgi:hypothetical protein